MKFPLAAVLGLCVCACGYPIRSTALSAVRTAPSAGQPDGLFTLEIVRASVPPRQRSGHEWDGEGDLPDPYVRMIRDGVTIFESPPIDNTLAPAFDATLPRNVRITSSTRLRIELWDSDGGSDDPIGIWESRGLPPSALPGAEALVRMDSLAELVFRADAPHAHRGVGIEEYEIHGDHLAVVKVIPESPAGRAGITAGDRIIAIGGRPIDGMQQAQAVSALSLAGERNEALTVDGPSGQRELALEGEFVWLEM
jgi:hypothetical protein